MFVEELTKIKESETYADELQKKARLDSKQVLEEARTKAAKLIETAEAQGKEKFDALIAEGQKISDEQYALSLDQTKQKCAAMIEKAKVNEQKAIKMIAERIVRDSVNN